MKSKLEYPGRSGGILNIKNMLGTSETVMGAQRSQAGQPKIRIRLIARVNRWLRLKHFLLLFIA